MAKEPRGAILSVRVSDDEQVLLRKMAEDRGTSVSDLVRSFVAREVGVITSETITTSTSWTGSAADPQAQPIWFAGEQAVVDGSTVTIMTSEPDWM